MSRKRVLIHAITWTTLVVFIVIASVLGIHFSNAKSASSTQPPPGSLDRSDSDSDTMDTSIPPPPTQDQSHSQRMIGSSSLVNGEPVSEVRSGTGGTGSSNPYVQSRPAYQKPAPYKPKLVLAKQLQLQPATGAGKDPANPNLVTQTVYGFLDFTTTVGNTVMVFTPQTKNVELIRPSSTLSSITATSTPEDDEGDDERDADDDDYSSTTTTTSRTTTTTARQPKLLSLNTEESDDDEEPEITFLESSETDAVPQQTTTTPYASTKSQKGSAVLATAVLGEYVNLVTEPSTSTSATTPKSSKKTTTSSPVEIRTQVNVVSSGDAEDEKPTSTTPKGFTLKLSNKSFTSSSSSSSKKAASAAASEQHSNGTISSSSTFHVTSTPSSVFAQVIATPVKSFGKFAQVTAQVVTPTKATSTSTASSASSTFLLPKSLAAAKKEAASKLEAEAARNNGNDEDDGHKGEEGSQEQFNDEPEQNDEERVEEGEELGDEEQEEEIKPTATVSSKPEEQTLYVLPQKPKEKVAQIYTSKTASPDSYSREPQLYVDIAQPAKPYDNYYVTSTPSSAFSSRKQFRSQNPSAATPTAGTRNEYSSRFTNRFSRKQASSTESNELTDRPTPASYEDEAPSSPSTFTRTRGGSSNGNRFRSRNNRGSAKSQYQAEVEPTASLVYSNSVTATPSRRFSGGRTRNGAAAAKNYHEYNESPAPKSSRGGYSPSRQKVTITPTTSTSIYRFKLNRPTGRWRFKPSPKPKVSIIKSKEDEPTPAPGDSEDPQSQFQARELLQQQSNGPVYPQQYGVPVDGNENYQYAPSGGSAIQYEDDPRGDNELTQDEQHANGLAASPLESLAPTTIRVATVTPAEFSDLEKYLEIATIKSPYVFQAGNVKNTRYITVTKTFTKELIQPTQAFEVHETLENILATRAPYDKILEGSNDVATLPVVVLGEDMATPPLETITQTFSTTQLMLKTSILPVLYDGVTTLYTLTQSYFVTRLVTAHKTVPPMELFQFVPTKSLREFNTALQEAESEHREQLLGSEDSEENDQQYQQIVAAPDELRLVGSEFDPSFMEDKIPQKQSGKSPKSVGGPKKAAPNNATNAAIPDFSNLTPEQLAFFRFLTANQAAAQQQLQPSPNPLLPNFYPQPQLPLIPSVPQFQLQSSPVVYDTVTTVVETKTLRILFGAKPTQTTLYSTRVIPTKVTTYISAPLPTAAPALPQIPNYFQAGAYPFGAFVG